VAATGGVTLTGGTAPTGGSSQTGGTGALEATQFLWPIDALADIGGHPTEAQGNPTIISDSMGAAVSFDGDGDRLLVDANPLDGATEFTIELVFLPYDAHPDNTEPRFFHIESEENSDLRVTVELRLNSSQEWYLDAYIKSETSSHVLVDDQLTHPVDAWAHVAITYADEVFTSYVNGQQELVGAVTYMPIPPSAKTSIGARMNEVGWFNGAIAYAAITHQALEPSEFAILSMVAP
jgi:hypothetical protein